MATMTVTEFLDYLHRHDTTAVLAEQIAAVLLERGVAGAVAVQPVRVGATGRLAS